MIVRQRLPLRPESVPTSGLLPDGRGLAVRVDYEGAPVGRVVGWEDLGDNTALATIELEWPMTAVAVSSLEFGLDAIVRESGSGADRRVVEITRLRGVGVFAARPHSTSMTTGEVAS